MTCRPACDWLSSAKWLTTAIKGIGWDLRGSARSRSHKEIEYGEPTWSLLEVDGPPLRRAAGEHGLHHRVRLADHLLYGQRPPAPGAGAGAGGDVRPAAGPAPGPARG